MRRGQTLPIVVLLALLVGIQVYIAATFTGGSVRATERLRAQLRAIHIGQSAQALVVARLVASPWAERWFRDGPAVVADEPLAGGSYSSFVETVPDPRARLVDVYVKATYAGSSVVMAWRVQHRDDSLEWTAAGAVVIFTFMPPETALPRPGVANPIRDAIDRALRERREGEPRALAEAERMRGTPDLAGVLGGLGVTPPGPAVDETAPLDGSAPRPQGGYVGEVEQDQPGVPPLPEAPRPPARPPVLATAETYPRPTDQAAAWREILKSRGIDPDALTDRDAQNPQRAMKEWKEGEAVGLANDYDRAVTGLLRIVDEMEDRLDTRTRASDAAEVARLTEALGALNTYLDTIARRYADERGLPPPDPATFRRIDEIMVNGQPPVYVPYLTAAAGYASWFSTVAGLGSGAIWR